MDTLDDAFKVFQDRYQAEVAELQRQLAEARQDVSRILKKH